MSTRTAIIEFSPDRIRAASRELRALAESEADTADTCGAVDTAMRYDMLAREHDRLARVYTEDDVRGALDIMMEAPYSPTARMRAAVIRDAVDRTVAHLRRGEGSFTFHNYGLWCDSQTQLDQPVTMTYDEWREMETDFEADQRNHLPTDGTRSAQAAVAAVNRAQSNRTVY